MYLIVILIAMGMLQLWGELNPLHNDQPFLRYRDLLTRNRTLMQYPTLQLIAVIGIPAGFALLASVFLPAFFWFFFATVILLYSLGRGEFAPNVRSYTVSCSENNWAEAMEKAREQGVDTESIAADDWTSLNHKMVESVAYQGFERLFAVLFWFVVLGPAGALLYRLSYLNVRRDQSEANDLVISRWLWAMEWPVVRLLGLSFAITGNFVSCVERWKSHVFRVDSPSSVVLKEIALGALSADEEMERSYSCTQREVSAIKRLYARTFWFWLGSLAVGTLFS